VLQVSFAGIDQGLLEGSDAVSELHKICPISFCQFLPPYVGFQLIVRTAVVTCGVVNLAGLSAFTAFC